MAELEYKMPCGCIVSGQVSHNWVDQITEAEIDWIGYCPKHDGEAHAESDRRLGMLQRWDEYRIHFQQACYFCGEYECADDCELAEELK